MKSALGGGAGRSVDHPINVASLPFAGGDSYRGLFILSSLWLFVALGLCWNLVRSKWGRASMAIRESELAAEASGVATYLHKVSAFAISAGIVAVAGVIGAERFLLVSPASGQQDQSFRYVIMAALGGLGTLAGPIIGAFALTFGFGISWVQVHLVNQQGLVFGVLGLAGVALAPEGTMGNVRKALAKFHAHRAPAQPAAPAVDAAGRQDALPHRGDRRATGPGTIERDQAVRWPGRGRRHRSRGRTRDGARPHRTEWVRQDNAAECHLGRNAGNRWSGLCRRSARRYRSGPSPQLDGCGPDFSEPPLVEANDRPRQRPCRLSSVVARQPRADRVCDAIESSYRARGS